ncbi:MAG: dihydrofolate reductase [Methylococcaceae bacterium]|jgi:dihydrofolate reductase
MKISIIAACDENNLIGVNGKLPFHLSDDLKRFKVFTEHNAVIMGRGTFDSIGRKPLPNRLNIVITGIKDFGRNRNGAIFVNSHEEALAICKMTAYKDVFIIGGESVFHEALTYADTIHLTRVHTYYYGGIDRRFFPNIDKEKWDLVEEDRQKTHSFLRYEKVVTV